MNKKTKKDQVLQVLRKRLPDLHEKYGVRRIALYGSFARDAQRAKSDVDLLVELSKPPGKAPEMIHPNEIPSAHEPLTPPHTSHPLRLTPHALQRVDTEGPSRLMWGAHLACR